MVGEHPLQRHDATGVALPSTENNPDATASDLPQNFVTPQPPLGVRHVRCSKDTLENFCGSFAFNFQSFFQQTPETDALAEARGSAAPLAFTRTLHHARD